MSGNTPALTADPADLSLLDAAQALHAGRLSAVELAEACLRRTEERNGGGPTFDGMVPAALGSDTCGSLRIPSACCGTSAIKPTRGLIPLDGVIPLASSLDHPGPMARTVADCAALLGGLTGVQYPTAPSTAHRPLDGIRIATTDRTNAVAIDGNVAEAFEQARRACQSLGAQIISAPAPWSLDEAPLIEAAINLQERALAPPAWTPARARTSPPRAG